MASDKTGIGWTDATWNPIVGCSIVSPGCTNCYAMGQAHRIKKMTEARTGNPADTPYFGTTKIVNGKAVWTGEVRLVEASLEIPVRWTRPRRIFVNSMGDVFHEDVPDEWIDRVFASMALAPQHTFQLLTKRAERMRAYITAPGVRDRVVTAAHRMQASGRIYGFTAFEWPLANVWLGVSAEDQRRADERIPFLLQTPAAIRFVSAEPLLGPIDFRKFMWPVHGSWPAGMTREEAKASGNMTFKRQALVHADSRFLDWIIVGGESGSGARYMEPQWVRDIRDQCAIPPTEFFFKQWGKQERGNTLNGKIYESFPEFAH